MLSFPGEMSQDWTLIPLLVRPALLVVLEHWISRHRPLRRFAWAWVFLNAVAGGFWLMSGGGSADAHRAGLLGSLTGMALGLSVGSGLLVLGLARWRADARWIVLYGLNLLLTVGIGLLIALTAHAWL